MKPEVLPENVISRELDKSYCEVWFLMPERSKKVAPLSLALGFALKRSSNATISKSPARPRSSFSKAPIGDSPWQGQGEDIGTTTHPAYAPTCIHAILFNKFMKDILVRVLTHPPVLPCNVVEGLVEPFVCNNTHFGLLNPEDYYNLVPGGIIE